MNILRPDFPDSNPEDAYAEAIRIARKRAESPWYEEPIAVPIPAFYVPAPEGVEEAQQKKITLRDLKRHRRMSVDAFPTHGLRGSAYHAVYGRLYSKQDGKCAICGGRVGERWWGCHKPIKTFVIDHSHATGKIRGLVCEGCNNALAGVEITGRHVRHESEYKAYLGGTHDDR